ncbi:MAG: TetR family transcriptional regulator C-terminal domain-containing protein, partial [Clostridiales bacterium]|nr:TetR family transcriptional regulator C-terminal domain-containing protein [Clostridiales bacterium]
AIVAVKLDCCFGEIEKRFDCGAAKTSDIYEFCFDYLLKNRDFTVVFTDHGTEHVVKDKIKEYIETAYSDTYHGAASFAPTLAEYYSAFIADGIVSVIRTWALDGCKQPPATMAELMHRLLSGVIS